MRFSDACTELAKLIQSGYYDYPESAGLAIAVFIQSLDADDDPKMALALAKHLEMDGEDSTT